MPKIVVTGIREIDRKLRQLGPKLANKIARQALRKGAKRFAGAAKAEAPVGQGPLRAGIKARAGKRSRKAISVNVVLGADQFPAAVARSRGFLYPAGVELGEPGEGREPDPFMERAFDGNENGVRTQLEKDIRDGIEREARR